MNIVEFTSIVLFIAVPILFLAAMILLAARTGSKNKKSETERRRKQLRQSIQQPPQNAASRLSISNIKHKTESTEELTLTDMNTVNNAEQRVAGNGEPRLRPIAITGGLKGQRPSSSKQGHASGRRNHLRRIK